VLGSKNWVVAHRTKRIVEKYGEDVVGISQKRYTAIVTELVECADSAQIRV